MREDLRAGIIHAVFPSRCGLLPSVRALLDFLAAECTVLRADTSSTVGVDPGLALRGVPATITR